MKRFVFYRPLFLPPSLQMPNGSMYIYRIRYTTVINVWLNVLYERFIFTKYFCTSFVAVYPTSHMQSSFSRMLFIFVLPYICTSNRKKIIKFIFFLHGMQSIYTLSGCKRYEKNSCSTIQLGCIEDQRSITNKQGSEVITSLSHHTLYGHNKFNIKISYLLKMY